MANQSFTEKLPKFVFRILWLPMGGVLFFLLQSVGGMKGLDAAVIAYPVCLFGQFTLAAAKYSCKASPIERPDAERSCTRRGWRSTGWRRCITTWCSRGKIR